MRIGFLVVKTRGTPHLSRHTGCLATQGVTLYKSRTKFAQIIVVDKGEV
jgi:hypothetical protein